MQICTIPNQKLSQNFKFLFQFIFLSIFSSLQFNVLKIPFNKILVLDIFFFLFFLCGFIQFSIKSDLDLNYILKLLFLVAFHFCKEMYKNYLNFSILTIFLMLLLESYKNFKDFSNFSFSSHKKC